MNMHLVFTKSIRRPVPEKGGPIFASNCIKMLICLQCLDGHSILEALELDHVATRHELTDIAILILYHLEKLEEPCASTGTPELR